MANIVANAFWTFVWKSVESYAISAITNKLFGKKAQSSSPTYSFGTLQTQTNSAMVMPLIYGEVKCAGNVIWANDGTTVRNKLVSFGVGKIKGFSDVRINDNTVNAITHFTITYNGAETYGRCRYVSKIFYLSTPSIAVLLDCTSKTSVELVAWINSHTGWHAVLENSFKIDDLVDINTRHSQPFTATWYGTNCTKTIVTVSSNSLPGCSYTAYVGDGEQSIDNRVDGATQEDKAKLVGGLKYDAYLAITATAGEKVSSDGYTVTAIVKGRIVKIYTSPTAYHEEWTDNPAWCFLDYMTSIDACGMTVSETDIYGCINAATYFDQMVNGKKRFTVNLILDEKKSHQNWINELLATCRSYRTYQRGMHGILVDKPELVSQIFNVKPDEDIEIWWQDLEEDIERLQITYIDPEYEYSKVIAQADKVAVVGQQQFRNKMPLVKKIEIYGINNFQQASREAWFNLNKAQTCPEWIRYKTNKRALNRTIGDVVGIYDPITKVTEPGLAYKRYRIMSMTEPQGLSIEMVMQEYNPNLYSDTMGSVAPVINITKLANPATPPPDVSDIQLAQVYYRQNDGTIISYITGACTFPDFGNFSEARLEYSTDNGTTWADAGKTNSDGTFVVDNVKTGVSYSIRIKVVNRMGIVSNGITSDPIYITGKDEPPSNVPSLTFTIDATDYTKIQLSWPAVIDVDLRGYRVMEGGAILTPTPITDTRYTYIATSSRQYNFSVVAIDNSGNPSEVPAVASLYVKVEPPDITGLNVVQLTSDGTKLQISCDAIIDPILTSIEYRLGFNWDEAQVISTTNITNLLFSVFDLDLSRTVANEHSYPANMYTGDSASVYNGNYNYMFQQNSTFNYDGRYPILARAVNKYGFKSVNVTAFVLNNVKIEPPDILNLLTEETTYNTRRFYCSYSEPADFAGYEFRYNLGASQSWDNAIPLNSGLVTRLPFETNAIRTGIYTVLIKAVNVAGVKSVNAAYDVMNLGDEIVQNLIYTNDYVASGFPGTKTNCQVVSGVLQSLDPGTAMYASSSTKFYGGNNTSLFYSKDTDMLCSSDSYPIYTVDTDPFYVVIFGEIAYDDVIALNANGPLWIDYEGDGNAQIFYRRRYHNLMYPQTSALMYSSDNTATIYQESDYAPYTGRVQATAEEYDVRVVINSGPIWPRITKLTANIDVPDITEKLNDIVIPITGLRLPIVKAYRAIKNVSITIQETSGSTALSVRTADKSVFGPLIYLYDKTGTRVNGTIDATIQGY